jgi:hypothetical protein
MKYLRLPRKRVLVAGAVCLGGLAIVNHIPQGANSYWSTGFGCTTARAVLVHPSY